MKMSTFRVVCYLLIASAVAYLTRGAWLSLVRTEEPAPGFSRDDRIMIVLADATNSLDVEVRLDTYLRTSVEGGQKRAGGMLRVEVTIPGMSIEVGRTGPPPSSHPGDVFITSTGAASSLLNDCSVAEEDDPDASIRDDAAFDPQVDSLVGYDDDYSAIWRTRSTAFSVGDEMSFTIFCRGDSTDIWASYLDSWYLRSPAMEIFTHAPDPDEHYVEREYCTTVSTEVQRGIVLQNSVPSEPVSDTGRAFLDPDSLWFSGEVPVIYRWRNCQKMDELRKLTLREDTPSGFGGDFNLLPAVVEATFSNTKERRSVDRNLFLGGTALGLVAAFAVEGIGAGFGILEGLLRRWRTSFHRLGLLLHRFVQGRRRKKKYEQMTLF